MAKLQTQPVPVRVDENSLLILLHILVDRAGGSVEFTKEDISNFLSSGKGLRVVGEGQKDQFGNLLFDFTNLNPVVDESQPFKAVLIQMKPTKDEENAPTILGPEGGLVN